MPEVSHIQEADLAIVYTEIGRGHPSYLDGLISEFTSNHPDLAYYRTDVFQTSSGPSRLAWGLVRWLYRFGARGGSISRLYGCLRRFTGSGGGGFLLKLLGRDLRKFFGRYDKAVLVAHPILAGILSEQNRIIYQHGELAAPAEALVTRCENIFVPLKSTAAVFEEAGVPAEKLMITGQCIETELVERAEAAYRQRLDRLTGDRPLTVALFSSGACPAKHLTKLEWAARSLFQAGHSVYLFFGSAQDICDRFARKFTASEMPVKRDVNVPGRLKLITAIDRLEGNRQVASVFDRIDLFVAPAHERTNWAIGLGLPLLILCPHIGSYSPLNARLALDQKVAVEIADAASAARIPETIADLRGSGELPKMARRGFGQTDINGFARAARSLFELVTAQ